MKKSLWVWLMAGWGSVALGAAAGAAPEWAVRRIPDAGMERPFEIAADELSVATPGGRRETRSVAAAASLAALSRWPCM